MLELEGFHYDRTADLLTARVVRVGGSGSAAQADRAVIEIPICARREAARRGDGGAARQAARYDRFLHRHRSDRATGGSRRRAAGVRHVSLQPESSGQSPARILDAPSVPRRHAPGPGAAQRIGRGAGTGELVQLSPPSRLTSRYGTSQPRGGGAVTDAPRSRGSTRPVRGTSSCATGRSATGMPLARARVPGAPPQGLGFRTGDRFSETTWRFVRWAQTLKHYEGTETPRGKESRCRA